MKFPQDPPDVSVPKREAGIDAREESTQKCEEGAPTTPASSIKVQQRRKKESLHEKAQKSHFLPNQIMHPSQDHGGPMSLTDITQA